MTTSLSELFYNTYFSESGNTRLTYMYTIVTY